MKKVSRKDSITPLDQEIILPEYCHQTNGIPVALVFPNTYKVGMASLGFLTVFRFLIDAGFNPERFFLDVRDSKDRPVSVESGKHLGEFDLIGFHFSFELDFVNAVKMLINAGIEPIREKRKKQQIAFSGGIASSANPLPLVDFLDAVFIGEIDENILKHLKNGIEAEFSFDETFRDFFLSETYLDKGESSYSSSFHIDPDWCDKESFSPILTSRGAFGSMNLIEISSGCPIKCKFCLNGSIYPKVRERKTDLVLKSASRYKSETAKIGLIGAIPSAHSQIDEILDSLSSSGYKTSLSSLSVSSMNNPLLDRIVKGGMKTLTLGVECFDEKVQRAYGKVIRMDKLLNSVEYALKAGVREIKIYLMLGLPGSDEKEVESIIDNVLIIRDRIQKAKPGTGFTISLNPFIPKIATVYERERFMGERSFKEGMNRIKKSIAKYGIRIKSESYKSAYLQYLLSNSDERIGCVILQLAKGLKRPDYPEIMIVDSDRYISRSQDKIKHVVDRKIMS